jgi:hypothetical protein
MFASSHDPRLTASGTLFKPQKTFPTMRRMNLFTATQIHSFVTVIAKRFSHLYGTKLQVMVISQKNHSVQVFSNAHVPPIISLSKQTHPLLELTKFPRHNQ